MYSLVAQNQRVTIGNESGNVFKMDKKGHGYQTVIVF
jgi:hypothetical protein